MLLIYAIFIIILTLGNLVVSFKSSLKFKHSKSLSSFNSGDDSPLPKYVKQYTYMTPALEERMKLGQISVQELNRYFGLSKRELEDYESSSMNILHGKLGVIISLEDFIVNSREVYEFAYLYFFQAVLGQQTELPTAIRIDDVIGDSFKDGLIGLGYTGVTMNENQEIAKLETRFLDVLKDMMNRFPQIEPNDGIPELLNDIINDNNEICLITSLPRDFAIKLIEKCRLVDYFKGRVHPDNLICPSDIIIDPAKSNKRYFDGQLLRSCYLMKKCTLETIFLSFNRKHILAAKRLGINSIAVRGLTMNSFDLRVADKVLSDTSELKISDLYKVNYNLNSELIFCLIDK